MQVRVPPPEQRQTFVDEYLAAAAAAGLPTVEDPISRTNVSDGMWVNAMPIDEGGRRVDSCTAYIMPLMRAGGACASNLRLIQSATVSRVVIEGGRAVGVQYIKTDAPEGQRDREIAAKKEVISAAGPYGSPRLLQLSGIGPPPVLNELGVKVILDLPVGQATLVRQPTYAPTYLRYKSMPDARGVETCEQWPKGCALRRCFCHASACACTRIVVIIIIGDLSCNRYPSPSTSCTLSPLRSGLSA